MKKIFTAIIVFLIVTIGFGLGGTVKVFTGYGAWKVKRVSPSPTPLRNAAIVPTGNQWDISVGHPYPWEKLYLRDTARWISWESWGGDSEYFSGGDYWYYSPQFKIYRGVSRATIWISVDDIIPWVFLRKVDTGAGIGLSIPASGYANLYRFDITNAFRLFDDGGLYQLEIYVRNILACHTGIIAYLSYDYGDEQYFTYNFPEHPEAGWVTTSMPFHPEGTYTTLHDLFPDADDAYITYDGISWTGPIAPSTVLLTGEDGDALRTFSFYLHIPDETPDYTILGTPIYEQRYLDYDVTDPIYMGTVKCEVPFINPSDFPDGGFAGSWTWEDQSADGGGWVYGTESVKPRLGYCAYHTGALPTNVDIWCEDGLLVRDGEFGEPVDFGHTEEEMAEIRRLADAMPAPPDTAEILAYREELLRRASEQHFDPSVPPTLPPFIDEYGFHKESGEQNLNPQQFAISAYPSPFNSKVSISVNIPQEGPLAVKIFDISGNLVRTIYSNNASAGIHNLIWNGTDETGTDSPSGIYLIKATFSTDRKEVRVTLIR